METLVIQLPLRRDQHAFNKRRWEELCNDPDLAVFPNKTETDRHGNTIMMPPAGGMHACRQGEISFLLRTLMPKGVAPTECPVSTSDGVKAVDVGWFSKGRHEPIANEVCFTVAPNGTSLSRFVQNAIRIFIGPVVMGMLPARDAKPGKWFGSCFDLPWLVSARSIGWGS